MNFLVNFSDGSSTSFFFSLFFFNERTGSAVGVRNIWPVELNVLVDAERDDSHKFLASHDASSDGDDMAWLGGGNGLDCSGSLDSGGSSNDVCLQIEVVCSG